MAEWAASGANEGRRRLRRRELPHRIAFLPFLPSVVEGEWVRKVAGRQGQSPLSGGFRVGSERRSFAATLVHCLFTAAARVSQAVATFVSLSRLPFGPTTELLSSTSPDCPSTCPYHPGWQISTSPLRRSALSAQTDTRCPTLMTSPMRRASFKLPLLLRSKMARRSALNASTRRRHNWSTSSFDLTPTLGQWRWRPRYVWVQWGHLLAI